MKIVHIILIYFVFSSFSLAEEDMSPEEYFINGTNLLKPHLNEFNPQMGLRYMLIAADKKYEYAPFGLCVALSIEKEILDLEHAYAWCYVADKIGNKYSDQAKARLNKVGKGIENSGGAKALEKAKQRAIETYGS
ncbi:hypothetical protein [Simiduia aestuariiviva]|uniref:Sel1 repeat family protein n=1 Tax=Simiduia aestuariiviva TaxID=1510459 RepID=A0A839UVH7_9GAMM|nr:hypothetical protein [Simiduia aestuariiviva]MBB3169345.1 hypothetical protein [Simiduia aestuariiviva]